LNEGTGIVKKKFGSLFEDILQKSPDVASRLKKIAREKNTHRPDGTHQAKKEAVDRMNGVVVEKKTIVPRVRTKPILKKNSALSQNRSTMSAHAKPDAGKKVVSQPKSTSHSFEGVPDNVDQFGENDGSSNLDVVIGLDFGTSSTKVIVRVPNFTGKPGFAVPFGRFAHDSLKYLLPTRLSVAQDGSCAFVASPGLSILTEIKIALMHAPFQHVETSSGPGCAAPATEVATAYLALTLRYVRCWFIKNKRDVFGDFHLNWSCNLGLPAAIDDDAKLRKTFNDVGKAAWLASRQKDPITISTAKKALEDLENSRFEADDMPWDFQLLPEVIAEVIGYARSKYRNEGLHLLVDIGASTLDVCSFILHKNDEEDDFSILTADVGMFGAKYLHRSRIIRAEKAISAHAAKLFDVDDPLSNIPEEAEDYIPSDTEITELVKIADDRFKEESKKILYQTLHDLRSKRDPRSPRWSDVFPVFICGGANGMPIYKEITSGIDGWLRHHVSSSQGARQTSLKKPESLVAEISHEFYHRLAVAWGLSFESFNVGTYSRPSEIENIPKRNKKDIGGAYIGKDMV
jgi:hypothetical protein